MNTENILTTTSSGTFEWRVEEAMLAWYRTHGERLSRSVLAERAQIHPLTVTRLKDRQLLDFIVLDGLCRALRCSPEDLLKPVPSYSVLEQTIHDEDEERWDITKDAFGRNFKNLLDEGNMTIMAFADDVEASRMTLQHWSQGNVKRVDLHILWRVAEHLEAPLNRFFIP